MSPSSLPIRGPLSLPLALPLVALRNHNPNLTPTPTLTRCARSASRRTASTAWSRTARRSTCPTRCEDAAIDCGKMRHAHIRTGKRAGARTFLHGEHGATLCGPGGGRRATRTAAGVNMPVHGTSPATASVGHGAWGVGREAWGVGRGAWCGAWCGLGVGKRERMGRPRVDVDWEKGRGTVVEGRKAGR
jgi:hypothetical protein